jgi:hypothetical protein
VAQNGRETVLPGRTLKREIRVALSTRAQPVWFRLTKWAVLIAMGVWLWSSPYFWWYVGGGLITGIGIHLIWRWKTKRWTQPWLGWNDLDAGRDE